MNMDCSFRALVLFIAPWWRHIALGQKLFLKPAYVPPSNFRLGQYDVTTMQ